MTEFPVSRCVWSLEIWRCFLPCLLLPCPVQLPLSCCGTLVLAAQARTSQGQFSCCWCCLSVLRKNLKIKVVYWKKISFVNGTFLITEKQNEKKNNGKAHVCSQASLLLPVKALAFGSRISLSCFELSVFDYFNFKLALTTMLSWAIYGAKLILNLDLSSKGWTGLKPKVVQIAPFKCSTGITDIWLIAQVEFKSWTTNWTPSQDFCLEVGPDPRVVRLCPQHMPGSCWDDAVGGRRTEAFGTYKILIENSVVWASSSVDLTSGILLNTFPFEDKACNNFWFFSSMSKISMSKCQRLQSPQGPGRQTDI